MFALVPYKTNMHYIVKKNDNDNDEILLLVKFLD